MKRMRRLRSLRGDSGQSLVEFALVTPILILMVLAMVDFARAWNSYQVITDAAREGARQAVIDNPTTTEQDVVDIIEAALNRASLDLARSDIQITGFGGPRGDPTTVRIEYDYELGWVGILLALAQGDRTLTLTTEIVMRNE